MSRQAQLPPRCPFQKRVFPRTVLDPVSPDLCKNGGESRPQHHRSPSQSSILEEQPPWLDDLLSDQGSNSKGNLHRRSASDSATLLNGHVSFPSLNSLIDEEKPVSNETGSGLENSCMYGPNSPRRRGSNVTQSENLIVSALSEYVPQNPLQYIDGSVCISGTTHADSKGDAYGLVGELDHESKAAKRHSGQRSRVRKLQYIAELERTVNVFQTMESELAARVASLLQQRVILSIENNKLKQQMASLQKEKLIRDDQYQSLMKEAEKLKMGSTNHLKGKSSTYFMTGPAAGAITSLTNWQMLDIGKLSLGGNPVTLNHGFRS
ncbi:hypothetical protein HHK36_019406 [Tetracentron sinense]|uniref:Uncharacterized protein n=1 Tax=Tetracentron sinense TaxID=13715 RepID=A0A834YXG6_TETSI|nr:hypothetical protein HHK36_019406 [Tetracentron sinense]